MKKYFSPEQKKLVNGIVLSYFQIFLTSGLIENSWILICFCIHSIVIYLFWLKYIKKISLHSYNVVGEEKSILIGFTDKCGYSLTLHPNLTSSSFIKVNCNVESKAISMNFCTLCEIKIHWSVLHLLLPTHEFLTCIGHLLS